jgi:hypothetical protein
LAAVVIGNKYRRALKIKAGLPALQDTMQSLNVESREVFETWLAKEKQYLRSLSKEPLEEMLEMEYYQKLVNWQEHECVWYELSFSDSPLICLDDASVRCVGCQCHSSLPLPTSPMPKPPKKHAG